MTFEWDDRKEQINISKHGIDFSTAALVFGDDNRIEKYEDFLFLSSIIETYIIFALFPDFLSYGG